MRKTVTVTLAGLLAGGTITAAVMPANARPAVSWQARTCAASAAYQAHPSAGTLTALVIDSTHLAKSWLKADVGSLYADASSPSKKAAKYVAKDVEYLAGDCG